MKFNINNYIFLLLLIPFFINSKKKALIIGVTGQDGSYLSELLLDKGYQVHGVKRQSSSFNTARIDHIINNKKYQNNNSFKLHYGDLTDSSNIIKLIQQVQPDEIYNLAAQSHVLVSFKMPEYTANIDALGSLRILEAIKTLGLQDKTKYYQASTSEMFGKVKEVPQSEKTPFSPRSPYGVAKVYAYWITLNYRQAYNIFACNGILFNHESPRRGKTFVTRKITQAVARIKSGYDDVLTLGNLDAKRDWGYAKDYVEAMWLMLQQDKPEDYVIATGETRTVREFVELAFKQIDIDIIWRGSGIDEKGYNKKTNKLLVDIDKRYFRPTEVDLLLGDSSKAYKELKWKPKTSFKELVKLMVDSDCHSIKV